ncbi:ATP-binding protein [Ectobacillus ponti]|uniref:AAA family ATPase n=1 Tax=Ectobacillus ponti TaxID=2961894 RepID=A0AA42BNY3_9BACI|nr:AAA family ATPase [Ectobacillus ponti]
MKLEQLHIYGYGKWEKKELQLADLSVIYGENEAGKSTIRSFIRSILFGFPAKGQLRYEPKTGGKYGGSLTIWTEEHGQVRIERIGRGEASVFFADGTCGGEASLKQVLQGLDAQTFDAVFSFDMHGLQQIHKLDREQLGAYLLSAGAVGTDALLGAERLLQRRMDELFRPNGRKPAINSMLSDVSRMRMELGKKQSMPEQYRLLAERQHMAEQELYQVRKRKQELQEYEKMHVLRSLLQERHMCEELVREAQEHPIYEELIRQEERLQRELETLHVRRALLQEQLETAVQDLAGVPDSGGAGVLPLLEEWRAQQPLYEAAKREREEALWQRQQLADQITAQYQKIGRIGEEDVLPAAMGQREELQQQVLEAERLQGVQRQLDERFALAKEALEAQEAEVRQLQAHLPPRGERKEHAAAVEQQGSLLLRFLPVGVILLGVGAWLREAWLFAGALGLCISLAAVYVWMMRRQQSVPANSWLLEREQRKLRQAEKSYEQVLQQYEAWEREQYAVRQRLADICRKHGLPETMSHAGLLSAWEGLERAGKLQEQLDRVEMRISRLNQQLRVFEQGLAKLKAALPDGWSLSAALDRLQEIREQDAGRRQLAAARQKLERERKEIQSMIDGLHEKQLQLWNMAGAADGLEFQRQAGRFEQAEAARGRLQALQQQIGHLQVQALSIPADWQEPDGWQQELITLQEKELRLQDEAAEAKARVLQLEGEGSYRDLLHEYEGSRSRLRGQAEIWAVYAAARHMLERAKQRYHTVRLPQVLKQAEIYFSHLTAGEYTRLLAPERQLIIERHDGIRFDSRELSQATAEQLYLAVRLALASAFHVNAPLIIDDSFVHFDSRRAGLAVQLLQQMARKRQILFFTCHHHMREMFAGQQVHELAEAAD